MNIGQAAAASGISAKMLRYYEATGLVAPATRTGAGYRTYTAADVATLRFIRRARAFGLPMDRVRHLLSLWHDAARPSREVKRIARQHIAELDGRIAELTAMRDQLAALADACHGDGRPDCPIIQDLAGAVPPGAGTAPVPARPHFGPRPA